MVKDAWDCYNTQSEPLLSVMLGSQDYYATWSEPLPGIKWWKMSETITILNPEVMWGCDDLIANPLSHELGIDQDNVDPYATRRLDGFKENIYILQLL